MIALSLFDGCSCARVALERAGIEIEKYYASEIDKYAIWVAQKNYPDTIQLGDVNNWQEWDIEKPDLIVGGSPCQGFSMAGKQLNFNDPRSILFFVYVNILRHYKPKLFLLENVKMKQEYQDVITQYLGVNPIEINSRLVSAQSRPRLYWTNISDIILPEDKKIFLKDIVLQCGTTGGGHIPSFVKSDLLHTEKAIEYMNRKVKGGRTHWDFEHHSDIRDEKSRAVVANFFKGVPYNVFKDWNCIRKFHPIECERLQTLPDNFSQHENVSNTQRYKMLGNAFTVDVIKHIFSFIEKDEENYN